LNKLFYGILLFTTTLHALHIEHDFTQAHKKAIAQQRILVVFLTKKGCRLCNKALMELLAHKKVKNILERRAVFVIVISGQKRSYPIEMLYTKNYPALFFLDRQELFACQAQRGNIDPEGVVKCLQKAEF